MNFARSKNVGVSKLLLAAVVAGCAFGSLNAVETAKPSKKHYIDEQAISITEEGIVIATKNGLLRAKTLRSDKKGVYVLQQDCFRLKNRAPNVLARHCRCGRWFDTPWAFSRHLEARECKYGHPYERR
jgi:hypothetical protein